SCLIYLLTPHDGVLPFVGDRSIRFHYRRSPQRASYSIAYIAQDLCMFHSLSGFCQRHAHLIAFASSANGALLLSIVYTVHAPCITYSNAGCIVANYPVLCLLAID